MAGCNSVLVTYKPPQNPNLTKLKLPKDGDTLYKIGELNEEGCSANFKTVRDESYIDNEYVYVQTDKGVVLHVNSMSGKKPCRGTKVMHLESAKLYEADILPFPYVCGIFIKNITNEEKVENIETESLSKGCVKK